MRSAGAWVRLAASGAIALLLTLSLIALPAAADEPFAGTVDEIAAALKQDPILVQQLMGSGEAFSGQDLARAVDEENPRIRNKRPASRLINSVRSEEQIEPWFAAVMAIRIAAAPGLRLTNTHTEVLIRDDSGFFINSADYQTRGRDASTELRALLATISALGLFPIVMRGLSWYGDRTDGQSRNQSQPKFAPSRKELAESLPTTTADELNAHPRRTSEQLSCLVSGCDQPSGRVASAQTNTAAVSSIRYMAKPPATSI